MQQLDYGAPEHGSYYLRTRVLTFETAPRQLRRLVENGFLLLLICALWGLLLFFALTSVV